MANVQTLPAIVWVVIAVVLAFFGWSAAWVRHGRRWQPLVDVLLLNAIVLAGLMTRALRYDFQYQFGRPAVLFAVAQMAGLLSLLIALMLLGGGRWSLRLPAVLVGLAAVWTIPLFLWKAPDWRIWEVTIGGFGLLVSLFVVLKLCQFLGMQIRRKDTPPKVDGPARASQFPLKDLVLTTGAAAVLFAVARNASATSLPPIIVVFTAIEGACLACIAAVATWAALGTARLPIRLVVLAITALATGSVHELFFKSTIPLDLPWWWLASIPALAGGFVSASLWVVRAYGYRFGLQR